MRLNSKLTWGLAWAGLALVIAVPSLDAFSGNTAAPALITSDTDQVKVASTSSSQEPPAATTTAPKPGSITINPDGTVVRSSSATTKAPTTTATTTPAVTEAKAAEVEAAAPPLVAPIPAPASARPKSQPAAATTALPAVAPAPPAPEPSQPLVIEEEPIPEVETAALDGPDDLIPPEDIPDDDPAALRAYLEERGLLEPYDGRSTASVQHIEPPAEVGSGDYDPDGFYLSDGPNSERRTTRRSARSGWWYDEYGNLIFY